MMKRLPPHFRDERAAFSHLEGILWTRGKPVCPHCHSVNNAGRLEGVRSKPSKKSPDGALRHGLWKCRDPECRRQFTIKVGTIFEGAHVPLHKMLHAFYLLFRENLSLLALSREIEIDYKSALLLQAKIRDMFGARISF